jgi:hypothetical protein
MTKPEPRIIFLLLSFFVAFVFHVFFGVRAFEERYESSKQTSYIEHFWLPPNAEVFTDKAAFDAKFSGLKNSTDLLTPESYQDLFASEKGYVLFQTDIVTYSTIHGKMAISSHSGLIVSDWPRATVPKNVKYLGDGKVEFQLGRNWLAIIGMTLAKGIGYGLIVDVALGICWLIWFIVSEKLTERRLQKNHEAAPKTT